MSLSGFSVLAHAIWQTAKISVPAVIDAMRGATDHARNDARLASWSHALLDHVGVALDVEGAHRTEERPLPFVVMSNHASLYDIPALFCALPLRLRMVAKTELFRVPIWGRAMRVSGFIEIDRGDRKKAVAALGVAKERMRRDGISVWLAPEGTRSKTGALGPFKRGGFHLALDTGFPILPVGIRGTREVLEKGSAQIGKGAAVHVRIGSPIDPADFGHARRGELVARVRSEILALSGQAESA